MSENVDILLRLRSELNGIKAAQEEIVKTTAKTNTLSHAFKIGFGVEMTRLISRGVGMVTRELRQMVGEVGRAMGDLDKLGKVSQKLGVSEIQNLQALRHAGTLTDVTQQTLDMALQRQVRRISEAARSTGEAVDALKELKLEAKELAKLAPDQQFEAIAEAMRGVKTQGDRVRLAMKLFDSEGVALVNTLALGSEGFAEIKRRLEAYGVAVSQMDVQKVQDANDAFAELRLIQKGFYQQLAIQLAPALTEIARRLADVTTEAGGMKQIVDDMTESLRDPATLDTIFDYVDALIDLAKAAGEVAKFFRDMGTAIGSLGGAILYGPENFEDARRAVHAERAQRRARGAAASGPQPGPDGDFHIGSVSVSSGAANWRLNMERGLLDLREERARLELDAFRTDAEKRPQLIRLLEDERDLTRVIIALRQKAVEAQLAAAQSPEERAKAFQELAAIEQLNTRLVETEAILARISSGTAEVLAGLTDWMNQFGTLSQQISGMLTGTLDVAINGLATSIEGLIDGTMTWGEAWQNLKSSIITGITQIVAQFIAQQLVMAAVRMVFGAAMTKAAVTEGQAVAKAWAPAAVSASIASYGFAAGAGLASYIAALGIGTGFATAMSGFEEGGLIPGPPSRKDNTVIRAATGEFVVNAVAASQNRDLLERINSGQMVRAPAAAAGSPAGPAPGETNINLAEIRTRNDLVEFMEKEGVRIVRADRRRRGERVPG